MNLHPLDDLFHTCSWVAFMNAAAEGKQHDSEYVRKESYRLYEELKGSIKIGT